MMVERVIDRVRYPNEEKELVDDRIPYDDVVASFERDMVAGIVREGAAEDYAELKRRWAERQKQTD